MFPPFDAGIFTAIVVMVAAADSVPAFNVEPFCRAVERAWPRPVSRVAVAGARQ